MFMDGQGAVYTVGCNEQGQLGYTAGNQCKPKRVRRLPPVDAISAGNYHALFLVDSKVYQSGKANSGYLRQRNGSSHLRRIEDLPPVILIEAGYHHSLFLDCSNCLWTLGINNYGQLGQGNRTSVFRAPQKVKGLGKVSFIAQTSESVIIKDCEGNVYAWGDNGAGQLGLGMKESPVTIPTLLKDQSHIIYSISMQKERLQMNWFRYGFELET
eukprot:CAMPEP_0206210360 /NCGR_PEP_ID=MMETSP0166-20121206/17489_1 /ASSEMBLY_ACC=CAM_ASM_000260 /TAXON_ID=95228 /ORGANISM="Vannella robusta, Strain DIVA3 518/3/11/1/6" /LENGTH=212 /DNA_ID=CAMNT_0053631995 /DNA_START=327 /DNA_END=965 /DNA_ORIENTATION=-